MSLCAAQLSAEPRFEAEIREQLRHRIESASLSGELEACGERIHTRVSLSAFYERRGYRPAWIVGRKLAAQADSLAASIRATADEGLRASDYHLAAVERELGFARTAARSVTPGWAADVDILLTGAYLLLASHSLAGRLDPETIHPEWFASRRGADFAELLDRALKEERICESLRELLPPQPGYEGLRVALADYRSMAAAGGWPTVPPGPTLRLGSDDPRVGILRARLQATGDLLPGDGSGSSVFENAMDAAVRRFQARSGLDVDGAVGLGTLAALNVPIEERVRQIIVNLERWRWLPQELGSRHVRVNIAGFALEYVDGEVSELSMRVIVGRYYRRTPVFSDRMTYLVLNPSWEVPRSIAVADILPQVRNDPTYLERMGMRVLSGWGAGETEVDPASVDWESLSWDASRYRIRQRPGPANALGRVKFMFPNPFNVYLHDTPTRGLFARAERAFSSGCIRLEEAIELALSLLGPSWSRERLTSEIASGVERVVMLPEPVPVHILYWTAWVDPNGTLNFRKDLYARDSAVIAALGEEPPERGEIAPEGE